MRSDDQKNPASITYSNHRTYQIISLTKKSNRLIKIQSNAVSTIQIPKSQSPFFFLVKETCYHVIKKCNLNRIFKTHLTQPLYFFLWEVSKCGHVMRKTMHHHSNGANQHTKTNQNQIFLKEQQHFLRGNNEQFQSQNLK